MVGDEPGLLLFLPPGASFGAERRCCIEVKGGPGLVHPLEPECVLLTDDDVIDLAAFDHLTVHADLMVHVKGESATIEVHPATSALPVSLCLIGTGAVDQLPTRVPRRSQLRFTGGSAVLSVVPNEKPLRSEQAALEFWALPCGEPVPTRTPVAGAVLARSAGGESTFGPVPAEWAFRWRQAPNCSFGFVTWWVSAPRAGGRPFVAASEVRRL